MAVDETMLAENDLMIIGDQGALDVDEAMLATMATDEMIGRGG